LPADPLVNQPVTFTAGGIPTNAQIDHYEWTFDDGTATASTTGPQRTHVFSTRGLKNVRVDVFAVGGGRIGSQTLTLEVR
jgi:PKD repeat protein